MKKILFFLCFLLPIQAHAQRQTTLNEAQHLGLLAGLAGACDIDVRVMHDYEEIASRIISNKAPSQAIEDMFVKDYAASKAKFYLQQKKSPEVSCSEVITNFTQMPIFRFTLFDDGTLITNEGKYLYPRGQKKKAPNAVQVYPATGQAPAQTSEPAARQNAVARPAPKKTATFNKSMPVQNRRQPVPKQQKRVRPSYAN